MFTGLIEQIGKVQSIEIVGEARRFRIGVSDEQFLADAQIGESISVNGTCLTATEYSDGGFSIEAVEETLRRTTLGKRKVGDRVNLERAVKANARLGGHIVQGHVDGVASVVNVRDEGQGWWVSFEPPFEMMKYIAEKGSICIDGISLTVANVAYSRFSVALISHTREATNADSWQEGASVNIEVDIIAKYVERLMVWHQSTL